MGGDFFLKWRYVGDRPASAPTGLPEPRGVLAARPDPALPQRAAADAAAGRGLATPEGVGEP